MILFLLSYTYVSRDLPVGRVVGKDAWMDGLTGAVSVLSYLFLNRYVY